MDSYAENKNALNEAWIPEWIAIHRINVYLTGENRIFLKFLTSTSSVARHVKTSVAVSFLKFSTARAKTVSFAVR